MFRALYFLVIAAGAGLTAKPQLEAFHRPVVFEPNRGQALPEVKWIARMQGYQFFVTSAGAHFVVPGSNIKMKLAGGRPWGDVSGREPTGGVSNYFVGNDPERWHTNVPHYARLSARGVYDGVDLVLYSSGGGLEYDFVLAPGADAKQIRLAFDGAERIRVDGHSGDLVLTAANGAEVRHVRPKVYQQIGNEHIEVAGGYELLDSSHATFTLAKYDRTRPLVIDPTVVFTRFLAGNSFEFALGVAADSSGNSYVTGLTRSTDFPLAGAVQKDQFGTDAFVTKLSPSGGIVFSTYLGGNADDQGNTIAVDSTGVFVAGNTHSSDFPVQGASFPGSGQDVFVSKIAPNGGVLLYSLYLGGSQTEWPTGIAVDALHKAHVVGTTNSLNFPTVGSFGPAQQPVYGGGPFDAFLAEIDASGSTLLRSTYMGGGGQEIGQSVAVRGTNVFVAGSSDTVNFPGTTPRTAICGGFVVKLSPPPARRYATCLGGSVVVSAVAVDLSGNAYVTGRAGAGLPTTVTAFQRTKPNPGSNASAFITALAPTTGGIVFSTYFGSSLGATAGKAIAIDSSGAVYIGGTTTASHFPGVPPLVVNPSAGFVSKLSSQLTSLKFSKLLGAEVMGVALFEPIGAI